jgi:hypothetical protein
MYEVFSPHQSWIVSYTIDTVHNSLNPGVATVEGVDSGTVVPFEYPDTTIGSIKSNNTEAPMHLRGYIAVTKGSFIVNLVQGSGVEGSYVLDALTGWTKTITAGGTDYILVNETIYAPAFKFTFTGNAADSDLQYYLVLTDLML